MSEHDTRVRRRWFVPVAALLALNVGLLALCLGERKARPDRGSHAAAAAFRH